jgi:hypothetical protein
LCFLCSLLGNLPNSLLLAALSTSALIGRLRWRTYRR